MKYLILFLILSFPLFLESGSVSFVQYMENYAKLYPFDGSEEEDLKVSYPLYPGDMVKAERNSFIEIALSDGNLLYLGAYSDLEFRAILGTEGYPDKRTYLYVKEGEVAYECFENPLYDSEPIIGFPSGDLYILGAGIYFIDLNERGGTKIIIIDGRAEVATEAGSVFLRSGEEAIVYPDGFVDRKRLSLKNEFFIEKVEQRRLLRTRTQSLQYVGRTQTRYTYLLDDYGTWIYEPEIALYVWRPTIAVGWTPYYDGFWRWTPHGWFWVSYEPWGYVTYHYGRWVWTPRYGWVWVPGYTWAPAWVYWIWWDGYFGWCPMGYYDYWWYYRWDWWWNWPPCWYNDCYFGFKGRIDLTHLDRNFWIFTDARNLGKSNPNFHKDFKYDFKGKEGLIFALNPPLNKKEILNPEENFIIKKNLIKDNLTPVFKLKEKPSQEAKNILSSFKDNVKENTFIKPESGFRKIERSFEEPRPSKIIKSPNILNLDKGEREPTRYREIERDKILKDRGEREVSSPQKREPISKENKIKIEPSREIKRETPKETPSKEPGKSSREIKRKESYNYYEKREVYPSREYDSRKIYTKSYDTPEKKYSKRPSQNYYSPSREYKTPETPRYHTRTPSYSIQKPVDSPTPSYISPAPKYSSPSIKSAPSAPSTSPSTSTPSHSSPSSRGSSSSGTKIKR